MDRITREFVYLFASRSDECAVLPELYARLRGQIVAEMEAAGAGGRIHFLPGNHEGMNLVGDLRDVTTVERPLSTSLPRLQSDLNFSNGSN